MLVLVVNCGSSSIKYQVREVEPADGEPQAYTSSMPAIDENVPLATATAGMAGGEVITKGLIENIGTSEIQDHTQALEILAQRLDEELGGRTIDAAGHRVVHGGERFTAPARVTNEVIRAIERLAPLAPLHNPAAAQGLRAMAERWPDMPQVVVFDTSFHQTMPREAWQYALPDEVYTEHGIRRYGFHGTSHDLVTGLAAEHLGIPRGEFRAVVLHLGNGASATAIRDGVSVDTSMGYTPLAGLVMGTRSGDLDPSVVTHLMRNHGYDAEELDTLMNRRSGLLGLAGEADMRQVLENAASGDGRARNALDVASYRLAKYVGGYHVAVGGAQAIVFTAGIGENSAPFRARVLDRLEALGVAYDAEANRARVAGPHTISAPESAIPVLVVPTDEEQAIARLTWELAR